MNKSCRVVFFLKYIGGGGAEGAMLNLARGLSEQGFDVELVLSTAKNSHLWRVPSGIKIVDLDSPQFLGNVFSLASYIRKTKPQALLSALHFTNEIAILAKLISGRFTKVLVCEQNTLSQRAKYETKLIKRLTPFIARLTYPFSDEIVAISQGVAEDLIEITGLSPERIHVIYNPAITPEIKDKAQQNIEYPWFSQEQIPIILGVGKLEQQKDFPTLIRAFSKVRQVKKARLVILGWGPDRSKLEDLISTLGLDEDVSLLGYVDNPFPYMAKASVFALSSAWEGFGNVIVEAMSVGTPVVSTDCKSGPAEILNQGQYGWLTPVKDDQAMAEAILKVLESETKVVDPVWLDQFSLHTVTRQYSDVLGLA
ncbi:MAG: glycosyltransferase [Coleofasciculaceae cyanobacterium]